MIDVPSSIISLAHQREPGAQLRHHRCYLLLACDLLAWLRLLALSGDLARAEPKTLRYRLLHTAGRIVRGQRHRRLKIPETWPCGVPEVGLCR